MMISAFLLWTCVLICTAASHSEKPLTVRWNLTFSPQNSSYAARYLSPQVDNATNTLITAWYSVPVFSWNQQVYAMWNITAFDGKTGKMKWTRSKAMGSLQDCNQEMYNLQVAHSLISFVLHWENSNSGGDVASILTLDLSTGQELWNYSHKSVANYFNPFGITLTRLAIINDDVAHNKTVALFVATPHNVTVLCGRTGTVLYVLFYPFSLKGGYQLFLDVASTDLGFIGRSSNTNMDGNKAIAPYCSLHAFDPSTGKILSNFSSACNFMSFNAWSQPATTDRHQFHKIDLFIAGAIPPKIWNETGADCILQRMAFDLNMKKSGATGFSVVWQRPYNCSGDFSTTLSPSSDGSSFYITNDINEDENDSQWINLTKISKENGEVLWTKGPFLSVYPFSPHWYNQNAVLSPVETRDGKVFFGTLPRILALDEKDGEIVGKGPEWQGGGTGGTMVLMNGGTTAVGTTTYNMTTIYLCAFD